MEDQLLNFPLLIFIVWKYKLTQAGCAGEEGFVEVLIVDADGLHQRAVLPQHVHPAGLRPEC